MAALFRPIWALLGVIVLASGVTADCTSYGVDYSNGGSYYIDGSSNQYFSFITVFQGCSAESINPVFVAPNGDQYACSAISTSPSGAQVTSTCGIPYSQMSSGTWKIIVSGQQIAVQRSITLTVGIPQTTTVIATPTIILGVTSTPRAQTVVTTVLQTQTLILVPSTVTAACNGATRTVTNFQPGQTVTLTSTVIRTQTDAQKTSYWQTTVTSTASCHYPSTKRDLEQREEATAQKIAAVTITVTETTFTVTSTIVTTIPATTSTEAIFRTVTATVTPAASTVCSDGNAPGATVTIVRGNPTQVTQTNIAYSTTHITGIVWVGQTQFTTLTNSASATACWRNGGWFGF
ncbi:hypothetical protein NKR23_g7708 [Pleurostoma richardsiae]|uniref:Uncharacterized protein n=1 Tax=Pleurostoma richardsiae TaxID=41990 RepID=A0AA38RKR7_9PEZI|nr:hypothetical protein NKR23_g7708 [Pleurostoma richardsiae]